MKRKVRSSINPHASMWTKVGIFVPLFLSTPCRVCSTLSVQTEAKLFLNFDLQLASTSPVTLPLLCMGMGQQPVLLSPVVSFRQDLCDTSLAHFYDEEDAVDAAIALMGALILSHYDVETAIKQTLVC